MDGKLFTYRKYDKTGKNMLYELTGRYKIQIARLDKVIVALTPEGTKEKRATILIFSIDNKANISLLINNEAEFFITSQEDDGSESDCKTDDCKGRVKSADDIKDIQESKK